MLSTSTRCMEGTQPLCQDHSLGSARKGAGSLPPPCLQGPSAVRVPTKGSREHRATKRQRKNHVSHIFRGGPKYKPTVYLPSSTSGWAPLLCRDNRALGSSPQLLRTCPQCHQPLAGRRMLSQDVSHRTPLFLSRCFISSGEAWGNTAARDLQA